MTGVVLQLEAQRRKLLSYISSRDGRAGPPEDILQEVMLRVFEQSRKQDIGNPLAYAYRVADTVIYDHARRVRREAAAPLDEGLACLNPLAEETVIHRDRVRVFERALKALTPLQREVFVRRRFDGLSREEIAQALGLSVEAVKKHLVRAMAELADAMDQADTQDGTDKGETVKTGKRGGASDAH